MEESISCETMPVEEPKLCIKAALVSKLNLADFQNAIPLLQALRIFNHTTKSIKALELRIEATPAFLKPKTWRIEEIKANSFCHISQLDVELDGPVFSRLKEAENATVSFVLRSATEQFEELANCEHVIELLPRNQWGGLSHLPDMIAAFVQPSEPAVEHILKQAAEILGRNGKKRAMDGYASGSEHAWEIAASIWSAVAKMGLDYAQPLPSFECEGQKVREVAQVAESGLGTCLDLALLFCSSLECAGLNPLVVFTNGHAFAGVWLKDDAFSTVVIDDAISLRKRIKLKELVLFETTVITHRPAVKFSDAIDLGMKQIDEGDAWCFKLAVDIRRARLQRIKPLASIKTSKPQAAVETTVAKELLIEDTPELPADQVVIEKDSVLLNPQDRLTRWQRKLLDLSLRNNLLNFSIRKKSIKLEAPDPGRIEDLLAAGQSLKLLPSPDLMDGDDPRNRKLHESRECENILREHALDALKRNEVFVNIPTKELDATLIKLYRNARSSLQEGGANTLFLAIGFLSWTKEGKDTKRYKAPLILVPVTLKRKSIRSGFTLTLHDDEPRFNPTLVQMLKQDFNLDLAITDNELPRDDSGLDVAAIWKSVRYAIKDTRDWEVTEDMVLSTFSFAKHLMWKDLTERLDQLRLNDVVRHLLDTPRDRFNSSVKFTNPKELDSKFAPEDTFCPLPADSSQLSAVMAASQGKNFVLIGPPGTGKSQTIANIISQCLAEGKRVLFVSEKIAALDVVYRRLREIGLSDFCLELHSNKARKQDVMEQLKKSWKAREGIDCETWAREATRLKKLRGRLNIYVQRLHYRYPNGLTVFNAIGNVVANDDVPELKLSWSTPKVHDRKAMEQLYDVVDRLEVNAKEIGDGAMQDMPWAAVDNGDWSPSWQQGVIDAAREVILVGQNLAQTCEHFLKAIGLPMVTLDRETRNAIAVLAKSLPNAFNCDLRFILQDDAHATAKRLVEASRLLIQHQKLSKKLSPQWSESIIAACQHGLGLLRQRVEIFEQLATPWPCDVIEEVEKGLSLIGEVAQTKKQLSVQYSEEVEQLNATQLDREWNKCHKKIWPLSWLGKRKIYKQLDATITGDAKPDLAKDVGLLAKIRALRAKISAIEIGPLTHNIWAGLKTKPELAQCMLDFQRALDIARREQLWEDNGFEFIAEGRCGEQAAKTLIQLRTIKTLDAELETLTYLNQMTSQLWAGLKTNPEHLEAALRFVIMLQEIHDAGLFTDDHYLVSQGICGEMLAKDLRCLLKRSAIEQQLADDDDLRHATAGLWNGIKTHIHEVKHALNFQGEILPALARFTCTPEQTTVIKNALEHLLGQNNGLLVKDGPVVHAATRYKQSLEKLQPAIDQLACVCHFTDISANEFSELALNELILRCDKMVRSENRLHAWCAWRKVCDQALTFGLSPLVKGVEDGIVRHTDVCKSFEVNYNRWWLKAIVDEEPIIREFVSAEHEKLISNFRELEDRFTKLTPAYIRAVLCTDLPDQDDVTRNSQWGTLRHEMNKKKRHMPLRELMSQIPTALTKLTPCLLMSPLSIAQYLAADVSTFDVVIFDEASQIPVWDAVGAIARGKQVVMVGDPKQLPPTSFFDRAESNLDDDDYEGDLESILDECIGANLPTLNLAWHYRSRSESLIAFSNQHYYNGELVTFPSPSTKDQAVSFHYINGVYERGGARINQIEAKALVAHLIGRLKSPGFFESGKTIGVVTFNIAQRELIEDLLDEERRKSSTIESFFSESNLEPVFVKNLENVQGDERDIIYFSVTYASKISGAAPTMNFGPMNQDGGERRLNVAITRAREELCIFCSFKPEQMKLTQTRAQGVHDLKHFLEFAEHGEQALSQATAGSLGGFESPFEEEVACGLARKGWELHTQIGVSSFRIDLAIVHPDAPGIYLAGVECDGATYHRSATARDRDKIREQVLRGLGWEILRVWSTDWWIDSQDTLEKIDSQLNELLEKSRIHRAEIAEKEAALLEEEAARKASGNIVPDISIEEEDDDESNIKHSADPLKKDLLFANNVASSSHESLATFVEADPASVGGVNPENFDDPSYDRTLQRMIAHVIDVEGPVLELILVRRIARAHGWKRTGARIKKRISILVTQNYKPEKEELGSFYWPLDRSPETLLSFRKPTRNTTRNVNEICMRELVVLAKEVLLYCETSEEAIAAMAKEIGLHQIRATSRERFKEAIDQAKAERYI